jgi:predicted site-specific integrase-resolvase
MQHKVKKEEKNIKDEVVKHIVNILTAEFAKEFPKRK